MKKILLIGLVILSVFIIYLSTMDRKVYYLSLGDNKLNYTSYIKNYLKEKEVLEKHIYQYSDNNDRITDIIRYIKSNKKYKKNTLKNSLIKADLVTLSINIDDVNTKLKDDSIIYEDLYNYIDELTLDFEKLIKLMREYCKEDILFIGYYNPYNKDKKEVINYLNKKYKEVCDEYNVRFINMSNNNNIKNIINTVDKSVFES